jgi:hypothetical protein
MSERSVEQVMVVDADQPTAPLKPPGPGAREVYLRTSPPATGRPGQGDAMAQPAAVRGDIIRSPTLIP